MVFYGSAEMLNDSFVACHAHAQILKQNRLKEMTRASFIPYKYNVYKCLTARQLKLS